MTDISRAETHKNPDIAFVMRLGVALQCYGIPSHRLEEATAALNHHLGLEGRLFSSPGVLFASFTEDGEPRTYMQSAPSGDINLEKLDMLHCLVNRVSSGEINSRQGLDELAGIEAGGERYGAGLTILCFCVASGGACRLFAGGWREILVSSIIGAALGLLIMLAGKSPSIGKLLVPIMAIGATVFAESAALALGPYASQVATLTGLIVLIPGLSLTTAMTELATGHVVSGTSRLASAGVVFLLIGFGMGLGGQLREILPVAQTIVTGSPLPGWTQIVAMCLVPLSFVVLFKARPRDVPWVFLAGIMSFQLSRMGSYLFGPELGGFIGALCLGLGSSAFARFFDRPAAIMLVPGIMLLVPGSIGFESVSSLLAHHTLRGVDSAFTMFLTAVSLVAGLLFAGIILAPKRAL